MSGGKFIVLRDCIGPGGERLRRNTVVELDDAQFIGNMLAANKLQAADDATGKRVKWHSGARWSKGNPADRPERPEDSLWVRRG